MQIDNCIGISLEDGQQIVWQANNLYNFKFRQIKFIGPHAKIPWFLEKYKIAPKMRRPQKARNLNKKFCKHSYVVALCIKI